MAKKTEFDYSDPTELLIDRLVIVGINGGTNLSGVVRYADDRTLVIVSEPTSALDIETQVVHTVVNTDRIDFIQFKTPRDK